MRRGGRLIVVADTTEPDPVGTEPYRKMLRLLRETGPAEFTRLIQQTDWHFVHDQWEAQMWAKLLFRVPAQNFFYFSPQTALEDYAVLQCVDPAPLLREMPETGTGRSVAGFVRAALARARRESESALGGPPKIAYLADGPHCVPVGAAEPANAPARD